MGSVFRRSSDGLWVAALSKGPRGSRIKTVRYAQTEAEARSFLVEMEGPPEWRHVDRTGDCWTWTGSLSRMGYGLVWDGVQRKFAHRVIFEREVGPIPDDMAVLHRCDNPPCVRPSHLFLGTQADNVADMIAKGRASWQTRAAA